MYLKYPLLIVVVFLAILLVIYSFLLYLEAVQAVAVAIGTQSSCANGKPLEKESARYMLHSYIMGLAGNRASLTSQAMALAAAGMALVAGALYYKDREGQLDTAYLGVLSILVLASLILAFVVVPSIFGGGLTGASGLGGIEEYKRYHEVHEKLVDWLDENKAGTFQVAFKNRIMARIQRYLDLESYNKVEVIYRDYTGKDLMGYLIYDNDHTDYPALYQAIRSSAPMTKSATTDAEKLKNDPVVKIFGLGDPPDFTYSWRYSPLKPMNRILYQARTRLMICLILVAFLLFHVLYQHVPASYILFLMIGFILVVMIIHYFRTRLDDL